MMKFTALCLFLVSLSSNAFHDIATFCDTNAGMSDSNLLALSSQAGFCQTYGYEAGKPECQRLSPNSYQAKHLTLHGLWPNQNACGQSYGYCGVKQQSHHCDYPPLELSPEVAEHLKRIMPSYNYGSCLERHEWNKHGSCQILSSDDYFSLAMRLVTEVDQSPFGQYLTESYGKTVTLKVLRDKIVETFGKHNSSKIYLGCKSGILVDIYVELPALIPFEESLESLIEKAPNYQYKDSCPAKVKISNFSKGMMVGYA